ncbi:MAG TPA: hypothetical protein VIR01_18740, partial [Pyrinomonadaceae bacterium]
MNHQDLPKKQGLYDPLYEHDACGMGFVVDVSGRKSHAIIEQAMQVLLNLEHRGASGSEKNTGDGAGILLQLPHRFLARQCEKQRVNLPQPGQYAAGMVFLPTAEESRRQCKRQFAKIIREEGQSLLGWRRVPTDNSTLGASAKACQPAIEQVFIRRGQNIVDDLDFERKLCSIR